MSCSAILCEQSSKIKCIKFASKHRKCPVVVSVKFRKEIRQGLTEAAEQARTQSGTDIRTLQEVCELDPQFAFPWYQLGQALLADNRPDEALPALLRARDEDVCPLRMTSDLFDRMLSVCGDHDAPLLDADHLLAQHCRDEIPGDAVLVDHVHPSFRSNQLISLAILQKMTQLQYVVGSADEKELQGAFDAHLQSLDDIYFLRGQRTLDSLRAWTQGRADGPPLVIEE